MLDPPTNTHPFLYKWTRPPTTSGSTQVSAPQPSHNLASPYPVPYQQHLPEARNHLPPLHHLAAENHQPSLAPTPTEAMAVEATTEKNTGAGAGVAGGVAPESGDRRSRFRRICVYCGSAKGRKASYQDAAVELGKELVERGIDLVYGGGSIGLMGLVSHAVHDGGRHVIGVIPKSLMPREVTGEPVGEVRAVSGMHERKAEMVRSADAFIALPGGYGTLDELLEVLTWAQLGIHKKPIGLLNVDGFYNFFLSFIDMAVSEGFIKEDARHLVISAPTAKELVLKLEEYVPDYEIGLVWEDQGQITHGFAPELEPGIASS